MVKTRLADQSRQSVREWEWAGIYTSEVMGKVGKGEQGWSADGHGRKMVTAGQEGVAGSEITAESVRKEHLFPLV